MTEGRSIEDLRLDEIVVSEIWSMGRVELVDEVYHDDFMGEVIGLYSFHGPGDYKEWVQDSRTAFPDLDIELNDLFVSENILCGKWTARGTHTGELLMLGLEPTGKTVEYSGLFIVHTRDNRIVREYHASDFVTMVGQLGLF